MNCVQSYVYYSWNNPQVYLAAAVSGKSAIPYYDITYFVANNTEGEILTGVMTHNKRFLGLIPKR